MGKQLVNLSLAAASRVQPFRNLQSRARTHAVLMIGLYELLGVVIGGPFQGEHFRIFLLSPHHGNQYILLRGQFGSISNLYPAAFYKVSAPSQGSERS
jgi:hypothetical protein